MLHACQGDTDARVRGTACWVVGSAVQNDLASSIPAVEAGCFHRALALLYDPAAAKQALSAVSAFSRGSPELMKITVQGISVARVGLALAPTDATNDANKQAIDATHATDAPHASAADAAKNPPNAGGSVGSGAVLAIGPAGTGKSKSPMLAHPSSGGGSEEPATLAISMVSPNAAMVNPQQAKNSPANNHNNDADKHGEKNIAAAIAVAHASHASPGASVLRPPFKGLDLLLVLAGRPETMAKAVMMVRHAVASLPEISQAALDAGCVRAAAAALAAEDVAAKDAAIALLIDIATKWPHKPNKEALVEPLKARLAALGKGDETEDERASLEEAIATISL